MLDMELQLCYICNTAPVLFDKCLSVLKSKHSQTRICDFIIKFLGDHPSYRNTEKHSNFDNSSLCVDCFNKIDKYDLACVTAERVEAELRKILLNTESMYVLGPYKQQSPPQTERSLRQRRKKVDLDVESNDDDNEMAIDDLNIDPDYECNKDNNVIDDKNADSDYIPPGTSISQSKKSAQRKSAIKKPLREHKNKSLQQVSNKLPAQSNDMLLKCQVCNMTFTSLQTLMRHEHSNAKPQSEVFEKHQHKAVTNEKRIRVRYNCTYCPLEFFTRTEYMSHMQTHKKKPEQKFKCRICCLDLKEETALEQHTKMHTNVLPLECVICHKLLAQKGGLVKHMNIHAGEIFYICDRCGKQFVHNTSFEMHMMAHDDIRRHKCPHCSRLFRGVSHLNRHLRTHSGEKPYSCSLCGKKFAYIYNRNVHERLHDGNPDTLKTDKVHACSFCEMAYSRKSKLADHYQKSHGAMIPHTAIGNELESNDVKGRSLGHSV